ncbi:MAG: tetratricopeptide repeat protein [Gammaproteobacteria bacterium]|jgi:TolB-like protein/Tfp pilus assembly protein PilF
MDSFLGELKRRKVFRVAVAYAALAWLAVQVADIVLETYDAPEWVMEMLLTGAFVGFPIAVFGAWLYEWTSGGLVRDPADIEAEQARESDEPKFSPDPCSVAVLPFADMSPGRDIEYFSDGLTESLLHSLCQVRRLKVAARTSAFAFKGKEEDVRSIGRKLDVAAVMEGSVRTDGKRMLITAQLVSAYDGYHHWSKTFDRQMEDIFAIQEEIARAVVKALRVTLLGEESEKLGEQGTDDAAAYQAYLHGRHHWNMRTTDGYRKAIEHYRAALDIDPEYAQAWAGIADAYTFLVANVAMLPQEGIPRAREAADAALKLDPDLAEAHLSLGDIRMSHDWDWLGAGDSYRQARTLNPGSVDTHAAYGRYLLLAGRLEDAARELRHALSLDPLSLPVNRLMGSIYAYMGDYDEAGATFDRILELHPDFPVHGSLAQMYLFRGDYERALDEVEKDSIRWRVLAYSAICKLRLGREADAQEDLEELIAKESEGAPFNIAQVYSQMGRTDKAFEWLGRAVETHDPGITGLAIDPLLDPIREDPRMAATLDRIGLGLTTLREIVLRHTG